MLTDGFGGQERVQGMKMKIEKFQKLNKRM